MNASDRWWPGGCLAVVMANSVQVAGTVTRRCRAEMDTYVRVEGESQRLGDKMDVRLVARQLRAYQS